MRAMNKIKVLYVEDDENTRKVFIQLLTHFPVIAYEANTAEEGLDKFIQLKPDIVITDIVMPGHNGVWLIEQIRKVSTSVMIVIMSAYYDSLEVCHTPGVIALPKPIESTHLMSIITNCIEHIKTQRGFITLAKVIMKNKSM
jgi:two-component system response regulator VanR